MSELGEWDDDTELLPEPPGSPDSVEAEPEQEPERVYPDLVSFVQEKLSPAYRRILSGTDRAWCPSWWKHEEAISRLEALWRSWEFLRLDGSTGMSVWWRDHADHHMGVLLSADGRSRAASQLLVDMQQTSSSSAVRSSP